MEMELVLQGLIYVFGELAPILIPDIRDALAHGQDLKSIDWRAKYGRSTSELQAEVNRLTEGKAHGGEHA